MESRERECNQHNHVEEGQIEGSSSSPGWFMRCQSNRARTGAKIRAVLSPGRGVVWLIVVSALGQRGDLISPCNWKEQSGS